MKRKERAFDGVFAEHIQNFVRQKRALGYEYSEGAYILSDFENFCKNHFPDSAVLDQEIGLSWAKCRESEKGKGQLNRISVIREFGKYMNSIGIPAYVIPPNIHMKSTRAVPYIFSKDELSALFQAADEFPYRPSSPIFHLIVSVIFRLTYCCGLRPIEARRLCVEDVDLKTGNVKILESKGHKDRIVVMSDDMLVLMRNYHEQASQHYPERSHFFYNHLRDGMYSDVHMQKTFKMLSDTARVGGGNRKLLGAYNLRHTFATHRLYQWIQDGEDVDACVAYLSEYMGHANLSDTAYYIHLVAEFFPQMAVLGFQTRAGILPGVPS